MSVLLERPLVELSRKGLSICILDDETDHVELTSRRLEAAGFPVTGTTNAQEALQKVRSGSCRVVVADLKMPGMDGLAFLEKALQCDPGNVRDSGDGILRGGFGNRGDQARRLRLFVQAD